MNIEYQIINASKSFCNTEEQLINLLKANSSYRVDAENEEIIYEGLKINYSIQQQKTSNNNDIIFIIKFSIENKKSLELFEKFDNLILEFFRKFSQDMILNILWDDISKYYGKLLYPKISDTEDLLRKVIYCFMGQNVGSNWTNECLPKEVSESIKRAQSNKTKNGGSILYEVDFIKLERFLFEKFPLKDISKIDLKKINSKEVEKFIDDYAYKSNWDRYFSKEIEAETLSQDLNELYNYRNSVAHNKRIRKEMVDDTEKVIIKVNKKLEECLEKIGQISIPEEQKEIVQDISTKILNSDADLTYDSIIKLNSWVNQSALGELNRVGTVFRSSLGREELIHSDYGLGDFSARVNTNDNLEKLKSTILINKSVVEEEDNKLKHNHM